MRLPVAASRRPSIMRQLSRTRVEKAVYEPRKPIFNGPRHLGRQGAALGDECKEQADEQRPRQVDGQRARERSAGRRRDPNVDEVANDGSGEATETDEDEWTHGRTSIPDQDRSVEAISRWAVRGEPHHQRYTIGSAMSAASDGRGDVSGRS